MSKIDRIKKEFLESINTNEVGIGYKDGYDQAINGYSPDYSGMVKKETFLKWLIDHKHTQKTYIEGYDQGYREGLKNKFSVQKVTISGYEQTNQNQGFSNGEGGQSVMLSIISLVNLHNFLVTQCCDALQNAKGQIKNMVDNMESTGVAVELCRELREKYFPKDFSNFDALHELIIDNDLNTISEFLENQLHTYYVISGETCDFNLKQPIDIIEVDLDKSGVIDVQYQELGVRALACSRLITSLEAWIEYLNKNMEQYDECCDQLLSSGMPREYYDAYIERCASVNLTMLNDMINHIKADLDYLHTVYHAFTKDQA